MFSKLRDTYLRYYPALLLITIITENISIILSSRYRFNNTSPIYNVFIFIQVLFILGFYIAEVRKLKQVILFKIFAGAFTIFALTNVLFIQKVYEFNQLTYLLGSVFIVIASCMFLYVLIDQIEDKSLFTYSFFWITSANLIFFTGTFFYFLFWYYLVKKNIDNGILFRIILTILNTIYYILTIIGFSCPKKDQK